MPAFDPDREAAKAILVNASQMIENDLISEVVLITVCQNGLIGDVTSVSAARARVTSLMRAWAIVYNAWYHVAETEPPDLVP